VDLQAVADAVKAVVVLDHQPPADGTGELLPFRGEAVHGRGLVAVGSADMDLNLGRQVQPERIEQSGVVAQLGRAPADDGRVQRVDQDKLVGVHRDAHPVPADEAAQGRKLGLESAAPVQPAVGVRGERDRLGADAEKADALRRIEPEDAAQALQVGGNGLRQPFVGQGSQPELAGGRAPDRPVETGIADLHGPPRLRRLKTSGPSGAARRW
jgi:hypothetical protein